MWADSLRKAEIIHQNTRKTNKTYILNPSYRLRNDRHRIVLFSKSQTFEKKTQDWYTFIHPVQAVMLSFFTHDRNYGENLRLLAEYFHKDIAYMEKAISSYIQNQELIYTTWKEHTIYFPVRTLVEREETEGHLSLQQLSPDALLCGKLDLTSGRFYSGPLLLTFMLTNRCLTQCAYCYADTSTRVRQPLSTPRILELIQEAAHLQVKHINLMGGEVLMHPDWDIILSELVRNDMSPEFLSTKMPLIAEQICRLRETEYRNVIQISLDACDPQILRQTLRMKESYIEEMIRSIRLLDQSGLPYQVSSVLTTYNCNRRTLTDLFRFLCTLEHLTDWRINPVSNSITADYQEFSRLKAPREEIEVIFAYIEEFIRPAAPFPILLNRDLLHRKFHTETNGSAHFRGAACSALNTHMFILPDGKVTICEQLYWNPRFIIGDVTRSGLAEVWNSPQASRLANLSREDIQEKSHCKECLLFDSCFRRRNRCWSDIIKAYGKECWDYPDPRCVFSPAMKNKLGY